MTTISYSLEVKMHYLLVEEVMARKQEMMHCAVEKWQDVMKEEIEG